MKITIVQAEINQAIENFIRDQITVNDGMKIEISFKATRGEEGVTAEIDIVADIPEPAPEPVKATRAPRQARESKPLNITAKVDAAKAQPNSDPTSTTEPEPAPADPIPDDPAPGSEEALAAEAAATEPAEEPADMAAEATVQSEQAEEATEAAPVRQSLFSGLKKPVN